MNPRISVIIPVYQDWGRLLLCLDKLKNQIIDFQLFEVIVVNNESQQIAPNWDVLPFQVRLIHQQLPGSYSARNKAIQCAQGDAYLFTDSDCLPDDYWIAQAIDLLERSQASLFAGKIGIYSETDNIFVRFEKAFAFPNEKYVLEENFGVTANLLVRRDVFNKVGDFNSQMMTGGDSEFCNRAVGLGFQIEYAPSLLVMHPARVSWREFKKKAIRFGGRMPKGNSKGIVFLKVLGKFRIRISDHSAIWSLKGVSLQDRVGFSIIKQGLRWVEANESIRVLAGKRPGRE